MIRGSRSTYEIAADLIILFLTESLIYDTPRLMQVPIEDVAREFDLNKYQGI